jgi:NADH dehydrogenase
VRIAVAGGTGFIGRYVSQALTRSGHEVVVLTRDPARTRSIRQLHGTTAVMSDVTRPSSLTSAVVGCEGVVMAVGFPNYPVEQPRKGLTFDRYDRRGTEALLEAATAAGARRFAYVSGAGADPTSDKSWYRAKGQAEAAIERAGIDHFILRPSWAYGPEDRSLNKFAAIARFSPVVPKPGTRPQHIQPVFVEDVAASFGKAFDRDDVWNRTFEIGGPDVMTMTEVIHTMLEVMGNRWRCVRVWPAT